MPAKKPKIELLAPAGNFEKLEIAIHYGADAVYLADKKFSLRNFSGNFSPEEMKKAIEYAAKRNVKVYIACNVYTRNFEQRELESYLDDIGKINPDALIVADPGVIWSARRLIPAIPLHLSTQSNTTNYRAVQFWEELGVKRVNVARELSLEEIKEISRQTSVEIEAFVHGAMCISYSGRCLLSSFLTKRDSNRGICSHPCRWNYSVVEEFRPGEYIPIQEDPRGTYMFNSRDLCMIEHIPELIQAGITSLKIEGRMKSINYLASTVKVYREAIDAYYADPGNFELKKEWIKQLGSISHRDYCTGFYFNDPDQVLPDYISSKPLEGQKFVGKVLEDGEQNLSLVQIRNKIFRDDLIEILTQKGPVRNDTIIDIIDSSQNLVNFAQPGEVVLIRLNRPCRHNDLIRMAGGNP
jgi:putative protease